MKKVLITGGAGFISHHIIAHIIKNTDWEIVTIDRLDISGNLNRLYEILGQFSIEDKKRLKIIFHDLKAEINSQIRSEVGKPDIILHLAAASHVDRSIKYPMEFVQDNVVGTVNLLDFARNLDNLERFVYFSTDEIFGNAPIGISYKEYDRYNSTNPYSASKAAGEEFCVAYENTYNLPIYITHTMNVFGERQHPEKYIPMVIQRVRDGQKVFVHSNKEKTKAGSRHYIHAQDVADGLMFILRLENYKHKGDFGNAKCPKFNLVGPEEIDNLELAKLIASIQNKDLIYELIDNHTSRPGHDLRYSLDPALLKKIGWEPKIKLTTRIEEVVNWSLKNNHWLSQN